MSYPLYYCFTKLGGGGGRGDKFHNLCLFFRSLVNSFSLFFLLSCLLTQKIIPSFSFFSLNNNNNQKIHYFLSFFLFFTTHISFSFSFFFSFNNKFLSSVYLSTFTPKEQNLLILLIPSPSPLPLPSYYQSFEGLVSSLS